MPPHALHQPQPLRLRLELRLHVPGSDHVECARHAHARHRLQKQLHALPANELSREEQVDGDLKVGGRGRGNNLRRLHDDSLRRQSVGDKPPLHERGDHHDPLEPRHRTLPPPLREHAGERGLPRAAERRAEKAGPHAARPRAVPPERRVGVGARTDRLVVVHVVGGLLRRKHLKRRHVRALVDDDLVVSIDRRRRMNDVHLMAGGTKLGDVPLGEHLDAAAHLRLLQINKNSHLMSLRPLRSLRLPYHTCRASGRRAGRNAESARKISQASPSGATQDTPSRAASRAPPQGSHA